MSASFRLRIDDCGFLREVAQAQHHGVSLSPRPEFALPSEAMEHAIHSAAVRRVPLRIIDADRWKALSGYFYYGLATVIQGVIARLCHVAVGS